MSRNKFKYRSAGVIVQQEHVLLYRTDGSKYWALPGGQIDHGESSEDSLIREMQEEVGLTVKVDRLLWVIENFYFKKKKFIHELGFYYSMSFPSEKIYRPVDGDKYGAEHESRLLFRWHPIQSLGQLELYPEFLRQGLNRIPDHIQHIVSITS